MLGDNVWDKLLKICAEQPYGFLKFKIYGLGAGKVGPASICNNSIIIKMVFSKIQMGVKPLKEVEELQLGCIKESFMQSSGRGDPAFPLLWHQFPS